MALEVDTNTYNSLTEFNDYFATRYNSASILALDDTTKESLLISATRATDLYCDWLYNKTDPNQTLEHPRNGETEVQDYIKIAQLEICFSIFESESVSESTEPELKALKADVVQLIFNETNQKNSTLYSDFTNRLLSDFCFANGSSGSKQLTRV